MTISTTSSSMTFGGNGATTVFTFTFIAGAASNITVTYTDASGVETVLLPSLGEFPFGGWPGVGGTITYVPSGGSPIADGTFLTIARIVPLTQTVSISNQGDFYPTVVEQALDTLCMEIQQINGAIIRAIQAPDTDPNGLNYILPEAAQRANMGLAFDAKGNVIAGGLPEVPVSAAMAPVFQAATLAAGRTAFGLGGAAVENLGGTIGDDGSGNLTLKANSVVNTMLAQAPALTIKGNAGNTAANVGDLTSSQAGDVLDGQFAGFRNALRNASLDVWQRGASVTITAGTPAMGADGVVVSATGANVTASQIASPFATPNTYWALKLLGQSGVTDLAVRFPIESLRAAALAGRTCTFQLAVHNPTGSAFTPAITVKHASAQDNWGSPVTDVNAATLQGCPAASDTVVAYTFACAAGAINGLSITVDFGGAVNGIGSFIAVSAFDCRVTATLPVGLCSVAPSPELRDPASEFAFCQRYFATSYDNGVAPGTITSAGQETLSTVTSSTNVTGLARKIAFAAPMRSEPSVTPYSPVSGSPNLVYDNTHAADTTPSVNSIGMRGYAISMAPITATSNAAFLWHWVASAEILGA